MLPEFDLTGQVALVTGGNRGIGRGIAHGLARAGADVVIAARDSTRTAGVVEELVALGHRAIGVTCDVTQRSQVQNAMDTAQRELGKLSILVNNAGTTPRSATPESHTEEDWDATFEANLKSVFFVSQAAYPLMVANGRGKIINISSAGAVVATEFDIGYGVSKAGLLHLTTILAVAWGKDNIQVNAILPGVVRTEMAPALADAQFEQRVSRHTPAGRVAEPEEFAGIAVFLASRASDFITGQALAFDRGITIQTTAAIFQRE